MAPIRLLASLPLFPSFFFPWWKSTFSAVVRITCSRLLKDPQAFSLFNTVSRSSVSVKHRTLFFFPCPPPQKFLFVVLFVVSPSVGPFYQFRFRGCSLFSTGEFICPREHKIHVFQPVLQPFSPSLGLLPYQGNLSSVSTPWRMLLPSPSVTDFFSSYVGSAVCRVPLSREITVCFLILRVLWREMFSPVVMSFSNSVLPTGKGKTLFPFLFPCDVIHPSSPTG